MTQGQDLRQAEELIRKRRFADARALVEARIARFPDDADAIHLLGVSYYFEGKIARAIETLKRALEVDPRHADAAVCLSVVFSDIGKYEEAKPLFEKANQLVAYRDANQRPGRREGEIDRKFAHKHLELAEMYFRYHRYDAAIEEYSKAALLDPENIEAPIRRAKAFSRKGMTVRGLQELQALKARFPASCSVRIQLGLLHHESGNSLDAELEWEEAAALEPSNREALGYLELARSERQRS